MLVYKVGDFGFAVNSVINSQQVGTYPYMSPELLRGEDYGSEVDVWALGVIAHQILFG
jgi:serine/threonine protein kinase